MASILINVYGTPVNIEPDALTAFTWCPMITVAELRDYCPVGTQACGHCVLCGGDGIPVIVPDSLPDEMPSLPPKPRDCDGCIFDCPLAFGPPLYGRGWSGDCPRPEVELPLRAS